MALSNKMSLIVSTFKNSIEVFEYIFVCVKGWQLHAFSP